MDDMGNAMQRAEQLMITLPSAMLMAILMVLIIHRMIDGIFPPVPGFLAMSFCLVTLYLCVWPPHPYFPYIAWVCVLSLMATYPFAESQLEKIGLKEIDNERLEKVFTALEQHPDNYSAIFEVAANLYRQGFFLDAIVLTEKTLDVLSTRRDEIRNTSMRDVFRTEEILLRKWKNTPAPAPRPQDQVCDNCNTRNAPGSLFCSSCKRPYLLDKVKKIDPRSRFASKLILSYALIGLSIVFGAAVGLSVQGPMKYVVIIGALGAVGLLLNWLFSVRSAGHQVKEQKPLYIQEG